MEAGVDTEVTFQYLDSEGSLVPLPVSYVSFYALDEGEKKGILDRIEAEKKRGKVNVQRFKGLGEMNPLQLRETTMDPNTRRLVQLTIEDSAEMLELMDMLLAKKRSGDRKVWLESKGNMAEVGV